MSPLYTRKAKTYVKVKAESLRFLLTKVKRLGVRAQENRTSLWWHQRSGSGPSDSNWSYGWYLVKYEIVSYRPGVLSLLREGKKNVIATTVIWSEKAKDSLQWMEEHSSSILLLLILLLPPPLPPLAPPSLATAGEGRTPAARAWGRVRWAK